MPTCDHSNLFLYQHPCKIISKLCTHLSLKKLLLQLRPENVCIVVYRNNYPNSTNLKKTIENIREHDKYHSLPNMYAPQT